MVWCDATVAVVTALLARCWFASCLVRCELIVAFVITFRPSGGVSTGVGSRSTSLAVLLVLKPVTTIPSLGVVALVGLIGLESQCRSREPIP